MNLNDKILLNEICSLKSAITNSICPIQKNYYMAILMNKIDLLSENINKNDECMNENRQMLMLKEEELSKYNGTKGMPAYVAVKGIIYDVSNEAAWGGGTHFGLVSGKDLTNEFMNCHGMESILKKLPIVGKIV